MRSLRLRQHGRALAFPRRLAGDDRQRGRAVPARRRRLHRRHEPLRGEAQPAPQRARLPVLDRLRPFREGAALRRSRAGGPGGDPAPAARLLRRHRRAHGHRSRRRRRRSAARLALRHDRAGGEDRPCDPAAARQHPLARRQELFGPAALPLGLGRRLHAVRAQRVDALHQPDEDARVPRRRRAGGLDADHRRRAPLRREGPGRDRQDAARGGAQGRGAARASAAALAVAGGSAPCRRLLGQDLGGDAQADARRPRRGRAPGARPRRPIIAAAE